MSFPLSISCPARRIIGGLDLSSSLTMPEIIMWLTSRPPSITRLPSRIYITIFCPMASTGGRCWSRRYHARTYLQSLALTGNIAKSPTTTRPAHHHLHV
ncbi:hypothetical protein PILCRDRAFT_756591 [Piloderma croceum F 1598]|uniref:Uncharacterized protein n=1 Tax=Piloderma croceum (strain F 1598) TaxID=765440 RepID=A0A0C3AC21_PILCF|nr:hypothetical protein PILCRDRAFT_756591 [Piloderma croceum F 1598]